MKIKKFLRPFSFGILAAVFALFLELLLSFLPIETIENFSGSLVNILPFLVIIALIEESLKGIFIFKTYSVLKDKSDIIKSSLAIGTGFFFLEFIARQSYYSPFSFFKFSGVFFVHLLTSFLAGNIVLKKQKNDLPVFFLALFLNLLIHAIYNISIFIFS